MYIKTIYVYLPSLIKIKRDLHKLKYINDKRNEKHYIRSLSHKKPKTDATRPTPWTQITYKACCI
jgi:hypothetical protein